MTPKPARQIIKEEFGNTDALRIVKVLRNQTDQVMNSAKEMREPLADYLEHLYQLEQKEDSNWNDSNKALHANYQLTITERIKALLTGNYKAQIDPWIKQGLATGFDWQTEDILQTLEENTHE